MRITMRMAAALGAFLSAGFLYAGAQCRLLGTVTDSAGAPIEGVAIIITTPKLGSFKLNLKTDAKGKYTTIMNDCTMPYHVAFEKEGYVSWSEDKKIPINDQGTLDAKLMKTSEGKAAPGAAARSPPRPPPGARRPFWPSTAESRRSTRATRRERKRSSSKR